jgi:hypothetical protein
MATISITGGEHRERRQRERRLHEADQPGVLHLGHDQARTGRARGGNGRRGVRGRCGRGRFHAQRAKGGLGVHG